MTHHYQDLIDIFNHCFETKYQTRLERGGDEPIYIPANESCSFNMIYFAHGYFSSALHECSHWFIAGPERRKLVDFGYWYEPDGRNAAQQALFQQVEIKPQAIEFLLSEACGYRFNLSLDNLNGPEIDSNAFHEAVFQQVRSYRQIGLPQRAEAFRSALSLFYK